MINIETIRYSLRNLNHNKSRSLLTIFSILIGIATIFIFISFGYGLYNYIDEMSSSSSADKILVMSQSATGTVSLDSSFALNDSDLHAIEKSSGVFEATGVYFTTAKVETRDEMIYSFLVAYDPSSPLVMDIFNIDISNGRLLKPGDKKKAVLGYNYQLAGKIFDNALEVNDIVKIDEVDMKIVGFFESVGNPSDDAQIYVTNDYFEEAYPGKTYQEIIARVDVDKIEQVVENVKKNLRKERGLEEGKEDFFVQSFDDMIASFSSVLNIIIGFVILIAFISIIVSVINTSNTMITSVLERYKEIGVMKSIGARNSEVFGIFLFESAFLGFTAGVLGVLLGWGFAYLAGVILMSLGWGFLAPYYSWPLFVGCIVFATLTGALSGIIPAYRASKTNIVDSLRYE